MESTQALEIIKEVAAKTTATLDVHQQIQMAVKTLEDVVAAQNALKEETKPKSGGKK